MQYQPPLQKARLLKRYKRFLADIQLPSGEVVTVHCPNTGSMTHCVVPDSECWYSLSDNPKRKYNRTLEVVSTPQGHKASINTQRANSLVKEAIDNGVIGELSGYSQLRQEVNYGQEKSRIDFLLSEAGRSDCYVEVKNVTLEDDAGLGLFPDAVSVRGQKHLRELAHLVSLGHRAVLLYCVPHSGIERVAPAEGIDSHYAQMFRTAVQQGVQVLAYKARLSPTHIQLCQSIPVVVD